MAQTLLGNRYARSEPLGSGGMAEVYLVHDEVLDRDVALKALTEEHAKNEELVERFRREARSVASLNHPNIVPVYDWGCSEDGRYYIVMEYLPGGTLKDRILRNGALDPSTAIELSSQVARALEHAHERGVIHRDIKPHNVLLTEAGSAKVTDFGIAKAAAATTTTSRSGPILGTAGYISPEQAMGRPVDARSDLYSLGVVLYEMLTGTLPFRGQDPASVSSKHVNEPPRSPREANPYVPVPLDALTVKLLSKDPEDRHASAAELADDLERVRSGLSLPDGGAEKARGAQKTAAMVTAPLPPTRQKRPEGSDIQPPATPPAEVPEGDGSRRGRLFRILATVLFGILVLAGLAWSLAQEHTPTEAPASEAVASKEEAAPSTEREVPELYYAAEAEGVLAGAGLKLGTRNEAPNASVPAGVVTDQDPAAGTTVEEGTAVDIVVSTGPEQVPAAIQAAPTSVGADASQAPATRAAAPTATGPNTVPAAVQAAPQAAPAGVAGSQQAPAARTASTTVQIASASSVHDNKKKRKGKKGK